LLGTGGKDDNDKPTIPPPTDLSKALICGSLTPLMLTNGSSAPGNLIYSELDNYDKIY